MVGRMIVLVLISTLFCSHLIGQDLEGKTYAEVDALVIKHYRVNAYDQAIICTEFAREKSRVEFGKEDSVYIGYTANSGFFYYNAGRYEKAEAVYLEAQALMLRFYGKANERYSSLLNNLATLYRSIGQYEMAESLYGEVKAIDKELFGANSPQYVVGLNNLALLYISQKRYADAEPLLLRTKEIRGKHYGVDHFVYAQALNNLAGLYTMMERYDEAVLLCKEAKNIKLKKFGKDHLSYSNSIHNLAALYRLQGNYEKAEPLHLEALKTEAKFLGKSHPEYVNSLNQLVLLYYFAGKYALAWSFLKESGSAITQVDLSVNITEAWKDSLFQIGDSSYLNLDPILKYLDLAYLLLEKQEAKVSHQKQVIVVDLALALLEKRRHGFFNYKDKLRLLSESNEWTLRSLGLLDKSKEGAKIFEVAEQNKSVLLMEASQAQTAYQMGVLPDSLILIEQEIIKEQEQIYSQLQDKRTITEKDSLRGLLNKFNKKRKSFKSRIEQEFPKYTNLKYQQNYAQATEIQALLKEDEAMLEYVIGDSTVYILYLDKNHLQVIEQPLRKEELSAEIKKLHRTLSDYKLLSKQEKKAYRLYTSSAHWFYQNLVAPALNSSSKIKKLIVITDGELGHLPFEVFLVEAAPQIVTDYADLHYLINDYVFSYHYSATLWKENKEGIAPKNNGQILGVTANYTTQIDSSKHITRLPAYQHIRANLDTLPSAREEVKMLSKQFEGYFAFDNNASEKIFKEKSSQFAVVHLAMHGLLNSRAQMLSSLVFTEDSDSVENNFLQAYEISRLNLNADLVVLSACETGYGKFEKGNGIASLARAFMYAGASSLVVSLWQVNDFSTGEIMKIFYQNLAKGMKKGSALREAKLEYMKSAEGMFRHPAFWSAFVQIGTTDAIHLEEKSNSSFLWWGLGVLTAVLLFVFWRKKK
jgi:LPXTG-motif cell wall-anchored protein